MSDTNEHLKPPVPNHWDLADLVDEALKEWMQRNSYYQCRNDALLRGEDFLRIMLMMRNLIMENEERIDSQFETFYNSNSTK